MIIIFPNNLSKEFNIKNKILKIFYFVISKEAYILNFNFLYTQLLCEFQESLHLLKVILNLKFPENDFKSQNFDLYNDINFYNFSNDLFPFLLKTYVIQNFNEFLNIFKD